MRTRRYIWNGYLTATPLPELNSSRLEVHRCAVNVSEGQTPSEKCLSFNLKGMKEMSHTHTHTHTHTHIHTHTCTAYTYAHAHRGRCVRVHTHTRTNFPRMWTAKVTLKQPWHRSSSREGQWLFAGLNSPQTRKKEKGQMNCCVRNMRPWCEAWVRSSSPNKTQVPSVGWSHIRAWQLWGKGRSKDLVRADPLEGATCTLPRKNNHRTPWRGSGSSAGHTYEGYPKTEGFFFLEVRFVFGLLTGCFGRSWLMPFQFFCTMLQGSEIAVDQSFDPINLVR